VDNEILEDQHKATLRSADRDEQVDHSDDPRIISQNENTAPAGLFQNQPETTHLLVPIRDEISLMGKEVEEKIRQLGQIVDSRRFNEELFGHK
jgi:hypothetical protein